MAQDPSEIRAAIEATRSDIAETMQALGEKADVKQRVSVAANEKVEDLKTQARRIAEPGNRPPVPLLVGVVVGLLALLTWRSRRRR